MLLFGVVSYKVRPPRLVSYACLYTTYIDVSLTMHINMGTYLYGTKLIGLGRSRYGTNEYSQSIINRIGAIFILI